MKRKVAAFGSMAIVLSLAGSATGAESAPQGVRFPNDPGVIDVTQAPYAADRTGKEDASDAIRAAIKDHIGSRAFIYFPNGTYKITKPLYWKGKAWKGNEEGWWARLIFRGQSRAGVVLRLVDHAPDFADPTKPAGVIVTASESPFKDGGNNQGFNNCIRDMTIDIGRGNPGAVGIDFVVSNQGAIKDVTILSGDGKGYAGIRMERSYPGPGLIKNVEIHGFDYGIKWGPMDYSMTLEHVILKNQNVAGILNKTAQAHVRDLTSVNSVPAIVSASGFNIVIGANLTGGASSNAAILSKDILARDLTVGGYGIALQDPSPGGKALPATGANMKIPEYVYPPAKSLFASPAATLRLPVEETPEIIDEDPGKWANVADFGAARDGKIDCTTAIQKALDSGKATVWLPGKASYVVSTTLLVPSTVRHIMGPHATIMGKGDFFKNKADPKPILRVTQNSPNPLILEHLETTGEDGAIALDQACARTIAWKHGSIGGGWGDGRTPCYVNTATGGKLFIEDCMGSRYRITGPQSVWARQLNTEYGSLPMLDVSGKGAKVWILGWKTENSERQPVLRAAAGAEVEAFGPFCYMLSSSSDTPLVTNDEARICLSLRQAGQHGYGLAVRETRDGETREFRNLWGNVPLYVGSR
jgi:hypothetical protein